MTFEEVWRLVRGYTMLDPGRAHALWALASVAGPGDFAELGCWNGGICAMLSLAQPGRAVHAFDTFAGLPAPLEPYETGLWVGRFPTSSTATDWLLQFKGVQVHGGQFPIRLAEGVAEQSYSLVHLDADTYASTRAGLEFFWTRLQGFLVIDDFLRGDTPGVYRAVMDAVPDWRAYQYSWQESVNQLILEKQQ